MLNICEKIYLIILKKLVNAAPSRLKCGTHIFDVRKAYVKGNVFINVAIAFAPPVARENVSINL
jgi:hypothetical protein